MFKEKWIEIIKNSNYIPKDMTLTKPDNFNDKLDEFLSNISREVYNSAHNELTEEDVIRHVKDQFNRSRDLNIRSMYTHIYNAYMELINQRRQEAWADFKERVRYLVFRILTAIGIAAVIMATYYLAARWGIQLPMTRAVLGAPL